MAQMKRSISFKKAMIDMSDRTITEYDKDAARTYRLDDILREWHGVEDITLSIQQSSEISAAELED